jgi:TRAP-type mannitol/chloroaromatic compound transport system permease small subunit
VLIAGKRKQAWINLLLTVLLYIPGLIHAVSVVKNGQDDFDAMHLGSKNSFF